MLCISMFAKNMFFKVLGAVGAVRAVRARKGFNARVSDDMARQVISLLGT